MSTVLALLLWKLPVEESLLIPWLKKVWELYGRGNVLEAVDAKLEAHHPDHNCKPSIWQAIQVLNLEAPLPSLPPNMPMPTYLKHETN
ncbi:hypothetical protein ACSBR2_021905 [Camellia fascicularis]